MKCLIEGCERVRKYRLLCGTHYERLRTTGSAELRTSPAVCSRCERPVLARGLCSRHYHAARRPRQQSTSVNQRLTEGSTRNEAGCLIWQGAVGKNGYGRISVSNTVRYVHRVAYETWASPIPAGLTIDHLCRVRMCIDPTHLEPVTLAENTRRELQARYNA